MHIFFISKSVFILLIGLAVLSNNISAEENPIDTLLKAKSLKCNYSIGYTGTWNDGKLNIEKGHFGNSEADSSMVFDSIDLKKGTARQIGNQGAVDVIVLVTLEGISFIEKSRSGNLMITTVFAYFKKGTNEFICVYSRHVGSFSPLNIGPMPSQWHGTCKIWK